jgi:hypothetical protein
MATIYKIYSPLTDMVYIGSTTDKLCKRMSKHKYSFNHPGNGNGYRSAQIFQAGGIANTIIEALEETDRNNQFIRERYWMEQHPTNVNKHNPASTEEEKQEAIEANKIYKQEWAKAQRDNPETREAFLAKQNANQKAYYAEHREEQLNKAKEYQKKNPEKISEKNKQNHQKLKEDPVKYAEKIAKLREKQDVKVTCACGKEITQGSLLRHMKSKEHATKLNLTDASSA